MKKTILLTSFLVVLFANVYAQENQIEYKTRPINAEFYENSGDTLVISLRTPEDLSTTFESKLPYPILFIHGLNSSSETWNTSFNYFNNQYFWQFGGRFDFCLNADNNNATANLNFFPTPNADIAAFETTVQNGDYYTINFNVNPNGTIGNNVLSNQSAIFKQGIAVKKTVERILQLTGKSKVIIVGHSMGGLAARQYIQNAENWQQPTNYHHVAKLVTLGTPHGGSNASDSGLGWFAGIQTRSEAIRDLKTTYYYSGDQGRFLFGGIEINNSTNMNEHLTGDDFYNYDVNCNGIIGEHVIGLNQKTIDNFVDYACVIGRITGGTTDGVVSEPSSNLNHYYPTLNFPAKLYYFNSTFDFIENHTELPGYPYQIMQGLDEPNVKELAYEIETNTVYNGFTTVQNPVATDDDFFKFTIENSVEATVTINDITTSSMNASILNSTGITIGTTQNNIGNIITFSQTLAPGNYFLKISSVNPTTSNYQIPYQFNLTTTLSNTSNEISNLNFYPNPVKNMLYFDNFSTTKASVYSITGQLLEIKNFNTATNQIDLQTLSKGIYLLVLENETEKKSIKIVKE